MKINLTTILSAVIGVLLLSLFIQNSCNRKEEVLKPIEVVVPAKEVTPIAPIVINEVVDTFYVDEIKYIPRETKPDTTLLNKYKRENDSLKKLSLYADAVTVRSYLNKYEDDNIKLAVFAQTTGTLDSLSIVKYTVKEQTIYIEPKKKSTFAVYIGGEMQIPTTPASILDATGKLYIQNKGLMYNLGYSVRGTASVGLAIKL